MAAGTPSWSINQGPADAMQQCALVAELSLFCASLIYLTAGGCRSCRQCQSLAVRAAFCAHAAGGGSHRALAGPLRLNAASCSCSPPATCTCGAGAGKHGVHVAPFNACVAEQAAQHAFRAALLFAAGQP